METGLVKAAKLNITSVGKETRRRDGHRPVSFLTEQEIYSLADAAETMGKHGRRNSTLIYIMFQSALRVSETLDLRLRDKQPGKAAIWW